MKFDTEKGYAKALELAKNHYENFPVVSFLVKKELRRDIAIIYWFARTADDIADEGNAPQTVRIENLSRFRSSFDSAMNGESKDHLWAALINTIRIHDLNIINFYNLLDAFAQDIVKTRYESFDELTAYCQNSANPVGRLILELYGYNNQEIIKKSDYICTALQLTNFLQDIFIDVKKSRIYLARQDWFKFSVSEKSFELEVNNYNLREIIKYYLELTEQLYLKGLDLPENLSGRLKLEISWTIFGGMEILNKIRNNDFDVRIRPKLSKIDFLKILIKSVIK